MGNKSFEKENRYKKTFKSVIFAGLLFVGTVFLHRNLQLQKKPEIVASADIVISHLKNLQKIAKEHGDSRSVMNGHLASLEYVVDYISKYKDVWKVWTEEVPLNVQVNEKPPVVKIIVDGNVREFVPRLEVATVSGSGSGIFQNAAIEFPSGCDFNIENNNFVAIVDTSIYLQDCTPCDRMIRAADQGAKGVIFIGRPGNQQGYPHSMPPSPGRCGRKPYLEKMKRFAAVSLGDAAAFEFLSLYGSHSNIYADFEVRSEFKQFISKNVLAETHAGKQENIILFGSHLDGVRAGPGINDDGSGSMATLELVRALAESPLAGKNQNKIRVAFWTGEEIGLLGSVFHVHNLRDNNPSELKRYKIAIDTDMIASPNYIRGVYDGNTIEDESLRKGCIAIQNLFVNYFTLRGLPTAPGTFDGRSDYAPFMDEGIASGGLFTGADAIKTPHEAELFGGISGVPLDPCYHQDCDRIAQLIGPGTEILRENMDAMSHALEYFVKLDDIDDFLKN